MASLIHDRSRKRAAVVFGADGQIGRALCATLPSKGFEVRPLDRAACDVQSLEQVDAAVHALRRDDVVFNAAAWTDVRHAELHRSACFETNTRGALNVALSAARNKTCCVLFSTDYVFDGRKRTPYDEQDPPNPINTYGATKYSAEILTRVVNERSYIARIASVFGQSSPHARPNFVRRMLSAPSGSTVELFAAGAISPTYAVDAAEAVSELVRNDAAFGVYHLANEGSCTWYEFGDAIKRCAGLDIALRGVSSSLDTDVRRPMNSALESHRLAALGIRLRPWRDALERYLAAPALNPIDQ